MNTYSNKSNATRAAKREFGEGNFELKQEKDGLWAYIRSGALDADAAKVEEKAPEAPIMVPQQMAEPSMMPAATEQETADIRAHNLGNGWSVTMSLHGDGTATITNGKEKTVTLPADSVAMLRTILGGKTKTKGPRKTRDGGPTLREQAAALLTQEGGTTSKAILELTKWPSVSVPALAKASKLDLRKDKVDGVTRYYGTSQAA